MPTVNQHIDSIKKKLSTTTMPFKVGSFGHEFQVTIWDNPHPVVGLENAVEGSKLAIASEPWTIEAELLRRNDDGSIHVRVADTSAERGLNTRKTLLPEELILHPDSLNKTQIEKHFDVYDGRSTS
jgi:hypothetical protein